MSETYEKIAAEVIAEVDRSIRLHGDQRHLPIGGGRYQDQAAATRSRMITDTNARLGLVSWQDILREEFHEAFAETEPLKVRAEMIQVAAVALKIIDAIDYGED